MTHRRTWKKREGKVAALFGSTRKPGSGSGGREDETSSDSKHSRLYVETKLRAKHTAVTLWDDTKAKADKEGKVPVVCLCEKGRPGFWIMVRSTDLEAVVKEAYVTRYCRSCGRVLSDDCETCKRLWES